MLEIAISESEEVEELEESVLGGEGALIRSYGLRVRRIGPLLSILFVAGLSFVCFGRVSAQFSHGIALFLSFSSYVLRKLESRLELPPCAPCNATTLGDSGGVSIAEEGFWRTVKSPLTRGTSEEFELVLIEGRVIDARLSAGFRDLELLGRRVLILPSSKHNEHPTGIGSQQSNEMGP